MEVIKYRILIVDENQEQIDDFKNFIESLTNEIAVIQAASLADENELFSIIAENEIDAVAFDYKLKENNSAFAQNGDVYQNMLLDNFENFPTFIITNNAADSKSMNADPFKIIDKGIINYDTEKSDQKDEALALLLKITQSIDKYRDNITSYEDELYKLIELQNQEKGLGADEIQRMIDLDTKLENSISKKAKIPKEWKSPAAIDEITNMVANSSDILAELKKLNND